MGDKNDIKYVYDDIITYVYTFRKITRVWCLAITTLNFAIVSIK